MKILAANSFNYSQNGVNQRQRNQSFGTIKLKPNYIKRLTEANVTGDVVKVSNILKKPINLKNLLNYSSQTPARRMLIDEFLSCMPEEEREDLTIEMSVNSEHSWGKGAFNSYILIDDKVVLKTKLPIYNSTTDQLEYDDVNLGFCIRSNSWEYDKPYTIEKTEPIHNKKLNENGFTLGILHELAHHVAQSIPTPKVFNYIAKKINELIDENETSRIEVRDEKLHQEELNDNETRKKCLRALLNFQATPEEQEVNRDLLFQMLSEQELKVSV